jgi:hypothetical protein
MGGGWGVVAILPFRGQFWKSTVICKVHKIRLRYYKMIISSYNIGQEDWKKQRGIYIFCTWLVGVGGGKVRGKYTK